jgi:hypothetical protein
METRSTYESSTIPPVRRWVIRVVALGLPLLLICVAWKDADVWPATGWRLFSGLRHGTQPTWLVEVETSSGEVRRFDPTETSEARRSWRHQLDQSLTDPGRQRELCVAWREDARAASPDVDALVVRRATIDVPTDDGPTKVVSSAVVLRC